MFLSPRQASAPYTDLSDCSRKAGSRQQAGGGQAFTDEFPLQWQCVHGVNAGFIAFMPRQIFCCTVSLCSSLAKTQCDQGCLVGQVVDAVKAPRTQKSAPVFQALLLQRSAPAQKV